MKKIIALLLCFCMTMPLIACSEPEKAEDTLQQTATDANSISQPAEAPATSEAEESRTSEKETESTEPAAPSDGFVSVNVTIDGVPEEWKKGIGQQTAAIRDDAYIGTTYKDTASVVSGYFFFVGIEATEDDYMKLLDYFDKLTYTDRSQQELPYGYETVYTCEWGNCQVRHNKEDASVHVSWRTFKNA
ncbi:MAG: hypothetical protein E7655_05480 [Ruminococcaceae bacterium]|nr:hypothetical protein [Oscillospiraceae bacterium]